MSSLYVETYNIAMNIVDRNRKLMNVLDSCYHLSYGSINVEYLQYRLREAINEKSISINLSDVREHLLDRIHDDETMYVVNQAINDAIMDADITDIIQRWDEIIHRLERQIHIMTYERKPSIV